MTSPDVKAIEDVVSMRYGIPGLGGRLRRARNGTGLSQQKVATQLRISWMTVHRWERSQRNVPDHLLDRLCELYDKPLRWFLTLEEGDLEPENGPSETQGFGSSSSAAAHRLSRKIAQAPASDLPMIEKIVEDLLDGLRRAG